MKIHYADIGVVCEKIIPVADAVTHDMSMFYRFGTRRCKECLRWVDKEKERIHNLRGRNLGVDIGIL